jgi:hypothetical protein
LCGSGRVELEGLGLLGGMGMLGALVNLKFAEQLTAQSVVRKHPFDGFLNDSFWQTLLEVLESFNLHATWTA